jgi:hypothetical protein
MTPGHYMQAESQKSWAELLYIRPIDQPEEEQSEQTSVRIISKNWDEKVETYSLNVLERAHEIRKAAELQGYMHDGLVHFYNSFRTTFLI